MVSTSQGVHDQERAENERRERELKRSAWILRAIESGEIFVEDIAEIREHVKRPVIGEKGIYTTTKGNKYEIGEKITRQEKTDGIIYTD